MKLHVTNTLAAALCVLAATATISPAVYGQSERSAKPSVSSTGVLLGAGVYPFKPRSSDHEAAIRALEARMGRPLAIDVHYFYWGPPGYQGSPQLTESALRDDASFQGDLQHGRTPLVSWRCGDNMSRIASGADDASIIIPAAIALRDQHVPIFLRWFYEWNLLRNGKENDRHYSQCFTQPNAGVRAQQAEFIAAWEHIWNVFQQQGAANVAFVWCIAGAPSNVKPDLVGFLPPRQYVDWTAEDGYDKTGIGFVATFSKAYDLIGNLDGVPNMIAESGETSANNAGPWTQARWFADAAANVGPGKRFANVRAFVYSDQPAGVPGKDWSLDDEGASGLSAMARDPFYSIRLP